MSARSFLDTNILVYAFTTDPRSELSSKLLARGCTIGVQCLNEFANVARRRLGMTWSEVRAALDAIRELCIRIEPSTIEVHEEAVELASRHGVSMFDSVMIATALKAGCDTFWSEDLQDGQRISDALTIRNPFIS